MPQYHPKFSIHCVPNSQITLNKSQMPAVDMCMQKRFCALHIPLFKEKFPLIVIFGEQREEIDTDQDHPLAGLYPPVHSGQQCVRSKPGAWDSSQEWPGHRHSGCHALPPSRLHISRELSWDLNPHTLVGAVASGSQPLTPCAPSRSGRGL